MDYYYYLAYGSNMDKEQMEKRCSGAKFIKADYLKGYKLEFGGYSKKWEGPVASIAECINSKIPYVLWKIDHDCLKRIKVSEGWPNHYKTKEIILDSEHKVVLVFEMTDFKKTKKISGLEVPKEYIDTIRNGYRQFKLSESFLDDALEQFSSNGT